MTLDERIAALRNEYAKGRTVLADLEAREREIEAQKENLLLTLARIEGAIQVVSELAAEAKSETPQPQPQGEPVATIPTR